MALVRVAAELECLRKQVEANGVPVAALTFSMAATALSVSVSTVRRMVASGELGLCPGVPVPRIPMSEIRRVTTPKERPAWTARASPERCVSEEADAIRALRRKKR